MHARWVAVITAWIMVGAFLGVCARSWGPDNIAEVIGIAVFALIILALITLLTLIAEAEGLKPSATKQVADRPDAVHDCNAHE